MPTAERADRERAKRGRVIDGKCSARRHSDGQPCKRPAIRGGTVCPVHGDNRADIRAAAQRRLDQAADVLVQRLLGFALDGQTEDNTALRAIIAALDRAGIVVPTHVDVAIGTRPIEEVFEAISGGSRAPSRAARGYADADDPLALEGPSPFTGEAEVIDVEPVQDSKPQPVSPRVGEPRRPAITGADALAEAHRVNDALGVYDRKALPPGRH